MSRRGAIFKRCSKCGRRVENKKCGRCGNDSFSWSYVVDVAQPGEARKQRTKAGFATKKEAQTALNDLLGSMQQQGGYIAPSKLTVAEFLQNEWLPAIRSTIRPSTFRSYQLQVDRHIVPRIGSVRLQRLDGGAINRLYESLAREGRKDGKGLSPASVRRVHAALRRALRDAVRWSKLQRNPADAADPPTQSAAAAPEMTTWTADELRDFLEFTVDDPDHALWLTLASTGMRRGEALGLRWQDVDLIAGRASIRQTLISVYYEIQFSTPKTKRGERQIALDKRSVETLKAHKKRQAKERLAMGQHYEDNGLVFARPDGKPIHPDRVSKLFDQLVVRWGGLRIRLHDLRHTHATLALRAGIHPKVVSERLGHSSVTITLDTYSHAIPAMQEEAAEAIAALIS